MTKQFNNIKALLQMEKGRFSRAMGYFGLGIGVLLLLCSMQLFININSLIKESNPRKNGYDYISVTKTITNENMGKDNTFTDSDIKEIDQQPSVTSTGLLIANQFRVKASAGTVVPFSTDLFLESIDDDFIDTIPPSFKWQQGQEVIPVIFSSDFLEMYNVFAISQGMPQLSSKTIASVNIILECSGPGGAQNFRGNIVALTDRINSVLVPKSFMDWANLQFGKVSKVKPSRLYIKTKDANDPKLISFIDRNNYHVNKDKTKLARGKQVLQNIVSSLAVFGILVIVLALMLFSFYLQLMIARSKSNLQLLLTLGYSPGWLSNTVARTWMPVYASIILGAILITQLLQYLFVHLSFIENEDLSYFLNWSVITTGIVLLLLSALFNYRLVKRELLNMA